MWITYNKYIFLVASDPVPALTHSSHPFLALTVTKSLLSRHGAQNLVPQIKRGLGCAACALDLDIAWSAARYGSRPRHCLVSSSLRV